MSLDKAIEHGNERRKPYRGSKAIDPSCRNHGGCPWCGAKMDIPVAKPDRIADELVREIIFVGKLSAKEMPSP